MPLNIPLPDVNKFGDFSDILQNLMQKKLQRDQLAQTGEYQRGNLANTAKQLEQQALANQQLNQYRMGQLGLEQKTTPLKLDLLRAQVDAQKALAQQRQGFGGLGSGLGGVDIKNIMGLVKQTMIDNPGIDMNTANQIVSAQMSGSETLPNGSQVPQMSGIAQQMITNIQRRNAPAQIQNQAAQSDILLTDLKNYDIDAVKSFTGPQGKLKLMAAQAKMATNPNDPTIDPMARRYIASIRDTISNMDQMRKAYGTSVVPDYVYKTIGRLANPNDSMWNDPKQVEMNFNKVLETIQRNRNELFEKVKRGVTASSKQENKAEKNENNDPLGIL